MNKLILAAALLGVCQGGPALATEEILFSSLPDLGAAPDGNVYRNIHPCTSIACSLVLERFHYQKEPGRVIIAAEEVVETPSAPIRAIGFGLWTDNHGRPGMTMFAEGVGPPVISTEETRFGTTIVWMPVLFKPLDLPTGDYWFSFGDPGSGLPGYSGGTGDLLVNAGALPVLFVDPGDSGGFAILGGTPVPESSTWLMMLAGFGLLGLWVRRRRAR